MVPEFVDAIGRADAPPDTNAEAPAKPSDDGGSEQTALSEVEMLARKLAETISPQPGDRASNRREAENQQAREAADEADRDKGEGALQEEDVDEPALTGTTLPAIIEPRSRFLAIGWTVWGVFVVGLLLSMFFFKEPIVEAWPPVARIYQALGLMERTSNRLPADISSLRDALKIRNQAEPRANPDGSFDLIISGSIENTTNQVIRLPRIAGVLRGADELTIYEWKVDLPENVIGPRSRIEFRTVVRSVPPETIEYEILPDWRR